MNPRRRDAWLRHRAGARLLAAERAHLAALLPDLFGFYALQIGGWGRRSDLLAASRVRHRFMLDLPGGDADCVANPAALPFANDSLDVVVLPHTLELVPDPHRVLREVERVLIGEGHVVILGLSWWSPWRLFRGHHCRALTLFRVRDWLALLGFELVTQVQHTGGAYVLVGRKRVRGMKLIGPKHSRAAQQRAPLAALGTRRAAQQRAPLAPVGARFLTLGARRCTARQGSPA